MAFAVCAHLIAACDFYNHELKGYRQAKVFVYKRKRGRKAKALTFTDMAFRSNPMPTIDLPTVLDDQRPSLFLLPLPIINSDVPVMASNVLNITEATDVEISTRITRSKRTVLLTVPSQEKVKRLKKSSYTAPALSPDEVPIKRGRGRPKKVATALTV